MKSSNYLKRLNKLNKLVSPSGNSVIHKADGLDFQKQFMFGLISFYENEIKQLAEVDEYTFELPDME